MYENVNKNISATALLYVCRGVGGRGMLAKIKFAPSKNGGREKKKAPKGKVEKCSL